MPGARRKRKGQTGVGKNAQVRRPSSGGTQFGGGPDNYDGAANTGATQKDRPERLSGEGKVIKTD